VNTTGLFLGKGYVSAGDGSDNWYIALFSGFPLGILTKTESDNAILNLYTWGIQFLDGSFLYFPGWYPSDQVIPPGATIPGAELLASCGNTPTPSQLDLTEFGPAGGPIGIHFDSPPFDGSLVGPLPPALGDTASWWAHANIQFVGDVDWTFDAITPGISQWPSCGGYQYCCAGYDLRQLYLPDFSLPATNFERANLTGTNFQATYLDRSRFVQANLTAANFVAASLKGAQFDGVDMTVIFNHSLEGTSLSNASFVGAKLTGLDLSKVNSNDLQNTVFDAASVDGVNLSGVDLSGASFKGVDLRKVQMDARTTLAGAVMTQANMTALMLTGIDMHHADLSGAILAGANFDGAIMYGVKFDKTDLTSTQFGANPIFRAPNGGPPSATNPRTSFVDATLPASVIGVDWSMMDLTNTTLVNLGQDLSGLNAEYAVISGTSVNLSGATLIGANFANSDLAVGFSNAYFSEKPSEPVATFESAILRNANFSGAKLVGANFKNVQGARTDTARGANFSSAYMVNAVLTEANLVKTSFAGAQLYGAALLDHADLQEVDFSNSILAGLNFNQAHLRGAVFDGAILINASLREVDLTPTIEGNATRFVGANLIGADFRGAHLNSANLDSAVIALDQGVPLFTVKNLVQWQPDLDKNLLSTELQAVFQDRGYQLRGSAEAYVVTEASEWALEQDPTYDLTFDSKLDQLSVAISEVVLFTLQDASDLVSALNAGTLPSELVKAIESRGATLESSADVDVVNAGSSWSLTQVQPEIDATGYTSFFLSGAGGDLIVFGTELLVSRLGPDNRLQLEIVDVELTKLTPDELGPNTVCPNRATYADNVAGKVTWMEMMTAASPAKPPVCVPSPDRWCSPGTLVKEAGS
jgi:uncharacterized protein YjbI with pentapeptide repeats